MKKAFFCTVLLLGLAFVFLWMPDVAQADDSKSPVGVWKTIDDKTGKAKSWIKIWKKDGKLYGAVIKLIDPPEPNPVCQKGPKKGQAIQGMTIMWGLTRDGDEWNGGKIHDPESGETYKCLIEVVAGGKKLKVRGYLGFALLGRTQHWIRVK